MDEKIFSKGGAIRYGWCTTKRHIGFFIGLIIIMVLVSMITGAIQAALKNQAFLNFIVNVATIALNIIMSIGITKILLELYDNKVLSYKELFTNWSFFWRYLGSSLLQAIIVFIGCIPAILFIIFSVFQYIANGGFYSTANIFLTILVTLILSLIGIYLQFRYYFVCYFVIDKNYGPIEALHASAYITNGSKWNLFLLNLLLILINIIGILCLFIGLFFTIPLTMMTTVYAYKKLSYTDDAGEK